ncbi:MAG: hypothetical protein JO209_06055 [Acidisphaera sp.]|nr:hypothetical protein [Acidisphaera sp.]
MPGKIGRALLESYSRGEVTRREIGERIGEPVGFGALLMQLHEQRLPLPRVPSDPQSPGVQLVKWLVQKANRAG